MGSAITTTHMSASSSFHARSSISQLTARTMFQEGEYLVVHQHGLAIRTGPSLDSRWIKKIPCGSIVNVIRVEGKRCEIDAPVRGWISKFSEFDKDDLIAPRYGNIMKYLRKKKKASADFSR